MRFHAEHTSFANHFLIKISLLLLFSGKIIFFIQNGLSSSSIEFVWFLVSILALLDFILLISFKGSKVFGFFLLTFSLYILVNSGMKTFSKGFIWPYYFEFALQYTLPILYFLNYRGLIKKVKTNQILLMATAATFYGHGALAIGLFTNIEGSFIKMTGSFFQVNYQEAIYLLLFMGIMDVILVLALFFNISRKYALAYAVFWGVSTSLARVIYNWNGDIGNSFMYESGGTIYRCLHGLVPLYLLLLARNNYTFFPKVVTTK